MADKPYAGVDRSDMAIPEKKGATGSYPVNTFKRAKAALGFVGMHGTPEEKARVRAKVASKYPQIEQTKGKAMSALKKKAGQYGA